MYSTMPGLTETHRATPSTKATGVLILGRKRPGFDQEWNRTVCQRAVAAMQGMGLECIGYDTPVIDDQTLRVALDRIRAAASDSLVILQPSMGNGQLALSLSQKWPDPILLWATPERSGDGKVSSCSLVGQHVWASMLRQAGHAFELVYGEPEEASLRSELLRAIALARTAAHLRSAKVGIVGTHAPGFVDLGVDAFLLRRSLGLQLHLLSLPQFIQRVNQISEDAVQSDIDCVHDLHLPMDGLTDQDLITNSRCYLAMIDLMREEDLDCLSIQCWPELPDVLGQWPYLAIARLTDEGHAVSMEGDADGAIAVMMGNRLGLGPAFLSDWLEHDASTIFLWHPGMAPIGMCNPVSTPDGPSLGRHFNIVKPLVVDGKLQSDKPATIARLWHCDGKYKLAAFEGSTIPPRRKVTGNSILFEVPGRSVPDRFDALIHEGMPHHVLLYYGHTAETHRRLARILGIQWIA
jgi:L-fucose isomerase-like protein